jgi:hypothetical protein
MRNVFCNSKAIMLVASLLFQVTSYGQGQKIKSNYYDNFSPATPAKNSFGAFGNMKVNHYTGMPEISLDLFTLEGRELNVPVALTYDASGVRTDDLSGPVGMKWNLNAGGSIVRDMNGLPDEHPDKGYLKFSKQTNYYTNLNPTDWTTKCENNDWDCAPDAFVINVNGRSIRFVFDQNKNAHTIPRQKVKIAYTLSSSPDPNMVRINRFEVTLENGTKYVFGGTTESVEERKIEKFVIKTSFKYIEAESCSYTPYPPPSNPPDFSYYCQKGFEEKFETPVETMVKTIPPFTNRWHLTSIILPSGEATIFSYTKLPDVKFTLKPASVRITNVLGTVPFYEVKIKRCTYIMLGQCVNPYTQTAHYYYPSVVRKFPKTNPGSSPTSFWTPEPDTIEFFTPYAFRANPGNVNFYHTLITESNIKLNEIRSINGNRVVLSSSSREDLPGAVKYDVISLYNMSNELIQSRKLNYKLVGSDESNDFLWFSESLILKHLNSTLQGSPFFASYFKRHASTDVLDPNFAKYVFEGLKDYNYKRTFLHSIEDVTNSSIVSSLFEFGYSDLQHLKRRTTTYFDHAGYHRLSKTYGEPVTITESRTAMTSNSYYPAVRLDDGSVPLAGRLNKMIYPTGGYTLLNFGGEKEVRLQLIEDFDHDDKRLRQRQFEYLNNEGRSTQVFTSFQDFFATAGGGWMKYRIDSSSPQNDSYFPGYYRSVGSTRTIAYDGTKTNNNGWEEYNFSNDGVDTAYYDKPTPIFSIPAESNDDGTPLNEIFPFPRRHDRSHLRGLLLSHKIYSKDRSSPVSETYYQYQINPNKYVPVTIRGFKGGTFTYTTKETTNFWYGMETHPVVRHRYATYKITADWFVLSKTRSILYDDVTPSEKIERVTEYTYDPEFLQQTETKSYFAIDPSKKVIARTKYATHSDYSPYKDCDGSYNSCFNYCKNSNPTVACYSACESQRSECNSFTGAEERGAIQNLRNANSILVPVESQEWLEENAAVTLLKAVLYKYSRVGNGSGVRKKEVWELNQPLAANDYKSSFCTALGAFSIDGRMRKVHVYDSYDATTLRLLSQTSLDGVSEAYQWDSNGSYLTSRVTQPGLLEQRTEFSYKPLVGMTSVKDANGVVSSYTFDPHGRLNAAYRDGELQTRYFYHKKSDTFKETLTAAIKVVGPRIIGRKIRFETPIENRAYGSVTYAWSLVPKISLGSKTYSEYTFTTPGKYQLSLKKTHPEFGSATANIVVDIYSSLRALVCVDGPAVIDMPTGYVASNGDCTTTAGQNTTTLRVSYEGHCGETADFSYRWELYQPATGLWSVFSTSGPAVAPPDSFVKRVAGQYRIRCIVTDSCGFSATSEYKVLAII